MRKIWIAFLMMAPCLFAQAGDQNCQEVSGATLTNFLNEKGFVSINGGTPVQSARLSCDLPGTEQGSLLPASPDNQAS